jgi:hypothetical protein
MKKANLWAILDLVFLAIFNVLFFLLGGTEHSTSVWISYGFIHFSYLMLLATPLLTRKGKSSALFGAAIGTVSAIYFFAEFLIGLIFVLSKPESYIAALVIQLILAGAFIVVLVSNMLANESSADAEIKHQQEVSYIKSATSEVSALLSLVNDKAAKKKVERAFDELNSSPTKSRSEIAALESNILVALGQLKSAVNGGNGEAISQAADELFAVVAERNRKLKDLN